MNFEANTPLTMTGIIATIVSLIFAVAALYNSHRRRKHAQKMSTGPVPPTPEEMLRKNTKELVRNMTPSVASVPAPALQDEGPRQQIPVQQPQPSVDVETSAGPSSAPLFRKLGLNGLEESVQKVDDTQYRWE